MASPEEYATWIVQNKHKRGTPEFDTVARAYELSKSQPATDKPEQGGMLRGIGEAALAMGTGAIAAPAGGLAGLAVAATPFTNFRSGLGAEVSQAIAEKGTYQPRTQTGQKITEVLAVPFEWLAKKADVAGEAVSDATGSPLLGTAANTAIQSIPLAVGKIASKVAKGQVAQSVAERQKTAADQALYNQGTLAAKQAGYTLPPAQVNPSAANKILQGFVGEAKLHKAASMKNQAITNTLVKESFGIPQDVPLTVDTLTGIRRQAGQSYDAIRGVGRIDSDSNYISALDNIKNDAEVLKQNFPNRETPAIIKEIESLKVQGFDSEAAIPIIRDLREVADKAYRAGDKKLGGDYKKAADAMEDLIERNLVSKGAPADLIQNFRDARKTIAQTYTVEKHLSSDGNVNAIGLGKELKRKPLEGGVKTAAKFGEQFPKAAQRPEAIGGIGSISPTWAGASALGAIMSSEPMMLGLTAVPPVGRAVMTSKAYQNMLVNPPKYGPGVMEILNRFSANEPVNQLMNIGGMAQGQNR